MAVEPGVQPIVPTQSAPPPQIVQTPAYIAAIHAGFSATDAAAWSSLIAHNAVPRDAVPTSRQTNGIFNWVHGTTSPLPNPTANAITSSSGTTVTVGYTYDPITGQPIPITYTSPSAPAPITQPTPSQSGQPPLGGVAAFNQSVTAYNAKIQAFDAKYSNLIEGNKFIGTTDQWKQYKQDFNDLSMEGKGLDIEHQKVSKEIDTQQDQDIQSSLKRAGIGASLATFQSQTDPTKWNLVGAIDAGISTDDLKAYGFQDGAISDAQAFIQQRNAAEEALKPYIAGLDKYGQPTYKLRDAVTAAYYHPELTKSISFLFDQSAVDKAMGYSGGAHYNLGRDVTNSPLQPITGSAAQKPSESVLTSIKDGIMSRFTIPKDVGQADLARQYEAQQRQSLLQRQLSSGSFIVKRPDGTYLRVVTGDAPAVVGQSSVVGAKEIIAATTATVGVLSAAKRAEISAAVQNFENRVGRKPMASEIVTVGAGSLEPTAAIDRSALVPLETSKGIETFPGTIQEPHRLPPSPLEAPPIKGHITGVGDYIPTADTRGMGTLTSPLEAPPIRGKITGVGDYIPVTQAKGIGIYLAVPTETATVPIDWNKLTVRPRTYSDIFGVLDRSRDIDARIAQSQRDTAASAARSASEGYEPFPIMREQGRLPEQQVLSRLAAQGIRAATVEALDERISEMYASGELTDAELAEYTAARESYLKSKGIESDAQLADSATNAPKGVNYSQLATVLLSSVAPAVIETTKVAPMTQTKPLTQVSAATQSAQDAATQTATATRTQTATQLKEATKSLEQTQEATQTQTAAQTATAQATAVQTGEAVKPAEATSEAEKVNTQEQAIPRELTREATATAETTTRLKLPKLDTQRTSTAPTEREIRSASAWPQGFGWWYVWRRGGKLVRYFHYGKKPLSGTVDVKHGKGGAYRGVQDPLGGGQTEFDMPLGVTHVRVDKPTRSPGDQGAIRFSENPTHPRHRKSVRVPR